MPFLYRSATELANAVNQCSRRVRSEAISQALDTFRLAGLATIREIAEDETTFSYTPKSRNIIMGECTPASCKSTPTTVDTAGGDTIRGFTQPYESAFEVCFKDCRENDLCDLVLDKEIAALMQLYFKAYNNFWFGSPQLMQFGLTNHPLTEVTDSPPTGTDGSSAWADKTNNQIMKELRECMKYMVNPVVLISEEAYENSLGCADEAGNGTRGCGTRVNCITELLGAQQGINFNGEIKFMEELDCVAGFDGSNIALVYDANAMGFGLSSPIFLGAEPISTKVVMSNRMINVGGMRIEYEGSVKVIKGI